MHDGSLKTLEEVVDFYDKGGKENKNLDEKIKQVEADRSTETGLGRVSKGAQRSRLEEGHAACVVPAVSFNSF